MSIDEYIRSMKKRNSTLFDAKKITITPQALEALVRHAYIAGVEQVSTKGDLFNQIFGGYKP